MGWPHEITEDAPEGARLRLVAVPEKEARARPRWGWGRGGARLGGRARHGAPDSGEYPSAELWRVVALRVWR